MVKWDDRKRAQRIIVMFRMAGASAGAPKCFRVFKTPITAAERPIKMAKGKVTRVSRTARANCSGLSEKPGARTRTTEGAKKIPRRVNNVTRAEMEVMTTLANSHASLFDRRFRYSEKTGTSEAFKVPSPKRRRR